MRAPRGSIRRRGGSFELSVRLNGRRYTRNVRVATREEAEDALLSFRRELRDEGVPDRDPTFAELAEEVLGVISSRVRPRTATRYEQLLRLHAFPVIGNVRVRTLPPGDIQRVLDGVLATCSKRTALHVYRVISEVLAEGERWGVCRNVAKLVRPPRPERPKLRIPDVAETKTILQTVKGSSAEGPTVLATYCGLRLGEALALRWKDVDLERARVRVTGTMYRGGRTEPKTARSRRSVAVPPFALQWLREHQRSQGERRVVSIAWLDEGYVFDAGAGMPLSVETVSRRFGQLVDQVGLGEIRFHDLRHAYATRLLEAGVHAKVVSEALGHSSIAITLDTYSHVLQSMSKAAADAIEEALG